MFSLHKESEEDESKCKCVDGCVLSFNGCSEYIYGGDA